MRVLVVSTNRERSPQTLIPLGPCCVASAAEAAGHEVKVLDLCFSRRPEADVEAEVRAYRPDVIGLSIRNLDNCDALGTRSYLPEVRGIVEACRRGRDVPIVIGGAAVSQNAEAVAKAVGVELAVVGEGEAAFVRVLENPTSTGVVAAPIDDLEALPDPRPGRWLDLRPYAARDAAMPIQTKRGCSFGCIYCCYPLLEGRQWRLREPEWVAAQVREAGLAGMRGAEFVDSVFNFPASHTVECMEEIARIGSSRQRPWLSTFGFNPVATSPELIDAMNAAKFSAVGVTAESGSDAMLDALGKGFTADDLSTAREDLRRLRARKMWVFMLGGPGETEATVRETASFLESLPRGDIALVTYGVRVLPRTELRRRLVEEGEVGEDDELIEPTFYWSPRVKVEKAKEIVEGCGFPKNNMVSITDTGHRMIPVAQRVHAALRLPPPYWRDLPFINRVRKVAGG